MPRLMADEKFRKAQWQHRYDAHVAPLNRLVDELATIGKPSSIPYIAPMYGGMNARLLSVLRDPGPKTQKTGGSGFLCMENDDATAERICGLFAEVGIDAIDVVPWNAYPWYINRAPKAVELDAGVTPLKRIVDLLEKLRIVMLHGGSAQDSWKRLVRRYPDLLASRKLEVIGTYHTSRQAFWHRDPKERDRRMEHLRNSFQAAASHLKS